eukprot:NODE_1_length_95616_cov_0.657642.p47 type:complete len:231 gc:universal NODE_1_length_95616_cov_0.657642:93977-93285(-)
MIMGNLVWFLGVPPIWKLGHFFRMSLIYFRNIGGQSMNRRLQKEIMELQNDPSIHINILDDMNDVHFTIQGPSESVYENGLYHGRLLIPAEYPLKPPSIYFLTPSGRFAIDTKICLSISDFHQETWNPSWSLRTALLAISVFMNQETPGAIGYIQVNEPERKRMTQLSRTWTCSMCAVANSKLLPSLEISENGETEVDLIKEKKLESSILDYVLIGCLLLAVAIVLSKFM